MRKKCFSISITVIIYFFGSIAVFARESQEYDYPHKVVPHEIIFKLRQTSTSGKVKQLASIEKVLKMHNISRIEAVIKTTKVTEAMKAMQLIYRATFNGNQSPCAVAAAVSSDPKIEWAEPRYLYKISEIPNDPMFSQQSFMNVIEAQQAWDYVKGEHGNIIVAVVDGGTDIYHPDLAANLWSNTNEIPANGLDDDSNGFIDDIHGWNFANNSNDPTGLASTPVNADHGTHTAGLMSAVTNNFTGVTGVSWNAKIMALNTSTQYEDRYLVNVYEGLLYAIQNGARVINCSFSEPVNTEFGKETIQLAIESGVAVVATAGNLGGMEDNYPAAYAGVLCVGSTNLWDEKSSFSSYGLSVDVMAPGENIQSLLNFQKYGNMSGTSMSCPIAAGIAALVLTQHPAWTGPQAAEQVRVTADNIDLYNPAYAGFLGKGRVNARRAVTESSPSIRIAQIQYDDNDHDKIIKPGETVQVFTTLMNYLKPAQNIQLSLETDDSYITLIKNKATISSLGTLEQAMPAEAFQFRSNSSTPAGHPVPFALHITSDNYFETEFFQLTVLPLYGNMDINKLELSVTNIGRIGFADFKNSTQGIGLKYQNGPNLLFEGAIIAGTGPDRLANAARGLVIANDIKYDTDFVTTEEGNLQILTPGTKSDQESIGIFRDEKANDPMHIRITQQTFAMQNPEFENIVIFRYTIENQALVPLSNFHFGFLFDWDIDSQNYNTNRVDYDITRKLGYAYDAGIGPDTNVGVKILTEGSVSFRAIYNDHLDANNPSWGLYDGFTDAEKWEAISGGIVYSSAGPADISFVIATGPHEIKPKGSLDFAMALLAGTDSENLKANADAAQKLWHNLESMIIDKAYSTAPLFYFLEQNYPNPFNSTTRITYQIAHRSRVECAIFDIVGQKVRTLALVDQPPGTYFVEWDGKDDCGNELSSGTFICHLSAGEYQYNRKILFIK